MKRRTRYIIIAVLLVLPFLAVAQGLVPCSGEPGDECQFCMLAVLISNVIDWLVVILSIITGIVFTVAGLRLVLSTGNVSEKEASKKLIINTAIGFIIVLACWILVDLIMKMMLAGGGGVISIGGAPGPWNTISCTAQPFSLSQTTEWPATAVETCDLIGPGIYDCSAQAAACASRASSTATYSTAPDGTESVTCNFTTTGVNPPDLSAAGACDSALVSNYFSDQVGNAQCIIRDESACGANSVSVTDVMSADGRAFSFGPMQINLTVHTLNGCGPGGTDLRCLDAFSGRNYGATVVNETLYAQCAAAAQDHACNLSNGRRIYQEAGNSWRPWSTAAGCGLR